MTARTLIGTRTNQSFLSVVSLWEIGIKVSIGQLDLTQPFRMVLADVASRRNLSLLYTELPHIAKVSELPFHHRDPFDRMLIAQALIRHLPIVSVDPMFDAYGVKRLW